MKKFYEAPEAILTGYEAAEKIANVITFDFDQLITLQGSQGSNAVIPSEGDIPIVT